jgi:glutamyl-tRNA synthetase
MISDDEIIAITKKIAYMNAIEHGGRANLNAVIGRILSEQSDLRKEAARVKSIVSEVTFSINRLTISEQRTALEKEYPGELQSEVARKREISKVEASKKPELPDLEDAVFGSVVTRFPPEPNGYMHIGHAKAAILGLEYAKKYDGRFMVRFDDTNPAAEKKKFYGAFLDSLEWLAIRPDAIKNASDDMDRFYEIALSMIQKFAAYVCSCPQEKMRQYRASGLACEHRSQSAPVNISLWESMLAGRAETKNSTLRFVGDMQSLNTAMRDPVLFRTVEAPHPLKDTSFLIWPTYDFDGPVEDSLDGVTHAMRSKEYELRDELYYAILDSAGLRKPRVIEFSRLQLKNTTVSKRNLRKLIEEDKVQGWDDPRLPTIAGLRRRGILPEAIREFVMSMGLSKVESQPTWDLLESINRKLLDPIAKRYFYSADPVLIRVDDEPGIDVTLKFHPNSDFGSRVIKTAGAFFIPGADAAGIRAGSKFRLIEAYNCEAYSTEGGVIKAKRISEEPDQRIAKIQWVTPEGSYPLTIMVTGPLLVDEEYNPESLKIVEGRMENSGKDLKVGEIFQLVRFGFCRLDEAGVAILAHK